MKIRHKLLVLLLAVSLVPMLVVVILTRRSIKQLSLRISNDIQSRQFIDTVEGVSIHVHNYREAILGSNNALQLALQLQARQVQQSLAESPLEISPLSDEIVYGFDETVSMPPEQWLISHPFSKELNFQHQQYFLTSNTNPVMVEKDAAQLWNMTGTYSELYKANRGRTLWHYTSLENGLHTSYPARAKNNWPDDYDPRQRNWYRQAKENQDRIVSASIGVDATTERLVLTVAACVYHPDGTFAGVTAIDKDMSDVLSGLQIPSGLKGRAGLYLVGLGLPGKSIQDEVIILFSDQEAPEHSDRRKEIQWPQLKSSDQSAFFKMLEDIKNAKAGRQIMEFNGQKAVWIYSRRISQKAALIMIVPFDVIAELAHQTQVALLDENLRQLRSAGLIILGVVVAVGVISYIRAEKFTNPINRLVAVAHILAKGDYSARADIQTGDEIQQLSEVFNELGPKLQEHERTQRSLALARAIQQNLLPQQVPVLPGFEVAGRCRYCDETGGDYFDFIHLPEADNQKFGIVLGDVAGHGVGAALLMASARSILRNATLHFNGDLGELMTRFNDQLSEDTGDDKFMTLFYGALDGDQRSLTWASGGHDPALWYHRQQNTFEELPNTGPLTGYMKHMTYEQAGPITLKKGDVLLIGTDGIWEAENADGQPYGKERLYELIRSQTDQSAEQIVNTVIESVEVFSAPASPADDVTVIVIKSL